jgi:anti-anti-sigma factor
MTQTLVAGTRGTPALPLGANRAPAQGGPLPSAQVPSAAQLLALVDHEIADLWLHTSGAGDVWLAERLVGISRALRRARRLLDLDPLVGVTGSVEMAISRRGGRTVMCSSNPSDEADGPGPGPEGGSSTGGAGPPALDDLVAAVRVSTDGVRTTAWLSGEHDTTTCVLVGQVLGHALGLTDAHVVVDLSEVDFLDASTVRVLLATRRRLAREGRRFAVRTPSPQARRVLELCELSTLVEPTVPALGGSRPGPGRKRTTRSRTGPLEP